MQSGAWRPDVSGSSPSRSYYLDVDVFLRGRIPIDLDTIGVELWAGVPIGLQLSFLSSDEGPNLDGFGLGWNVGVTFGGLNRASGVRAALFHVRVWGCSPLSAL